MTIRLALVALVLCLCAAHNPAAQLRPLTRPHVEALASEKLAGREAGSQGERLAAEYLARQLELFGARPLPGHGSDGAERCHP